MGGRGARSGFAFRNEDVNAAAPGLGAYSFGKVTELDIKPFKGWTLEKAENYLRELDHEEMLVFDSAGKLVAGFEGDEDTVRFYVSLFRKAGFTITHGHPQRNARFGGTFSWDDVVNMLKSEWREYRAVAAGQGEMNYIIRRTNEARPTELLAKIAQEKPQVEARRSALYTNTYQDAIDKGKTQEQALHIARQQSVGVLHKYFKQVLKRYGFEYVARKKPYHYGR